MSRIDDLIADLCPDGVSYRPLGDIAELVRGNGMPKSVLTETGVGAIHYGQIYTKYRTWTERTISFVSPETASRLATAKNGDIIITNTSENLEDVGKAVAWLGKSPIVTGGHATIIRHSLDPKYLSYWLQTPSFSVQKRALASGTKVIDVSAKQLAKIRVPVPPLEVQQEIVRILDTFSDLEAELEAELEARRRQYLHYRTGVFEELTRGDTEQVLLKDLGTWYGGGTPSKRKAEYWSSGTIPWISPKDMASSVIETTQDYITETAVVESSTKKVPAHAVALVVRSSILNHSLPVSYVPQDSTLNQDMKAVVAREGIIPRYLFHVLRGHRSSLLRSARRAGGSVASLDSNKLWNFSVPVPSMNEQRRICGLFDRFDALVNDLSSGLPAEIEARRKQYECYRDKLLTFEEATS